MKRTRLKKVSKQPISVIQKLLWIECKRIVDEQFGTNCYTCPQKNLKGANKQLGHVPWPKASLGAYLKYDIRLLRNQCFSCNIHRGGMGAEAYKRMLKEEGKAYMDRLEKDRQVTVKAYDHYAKLLAEYKTITK
jgi:hypothetical protein